MVVVYGGEQRTNILLLTGVRSDVMWAGGIACSDNKEAKVVLVEVTRAKMQWGRFVGK